MDGSIVILVKGKSATGSLTASLWPKPGCLGGLISQTIPKLQERGLIDVTDAIGRTLASGKERTGRTHIFYSSTCANNDTDLCTF